MNELKHDLLELVGLHGPSGFEGPVAEWIRKRVESSVTHVEIDGVGNVLATKAGPPGSPVLMLMAHMDQVSMVVTSIPDGFVRFDYVGSIYPACVVAHPVLILTDSGPVPGVVGSPSYHMGQTALENLWIDVGSRVDRVRVGDPIVFDSVPRWLDDDEKILAARSLDDRTGCAILLELARRFQTVKLNTTVIFTFTVQEEVFARGAQFAAKHVHPRWVIAVDGGTAQNPSLKPEANCPPFDDGLVVRRYETIKPQRGVLTYWADPGLVRALARAAERTGHRLHYDARYNVYTDAAGATEAWMDIKCTTLSTPRRYGHAPLEIVHMDTIGKAVTVLDAFLRAEHGSS
jgi:putative aminopeptidase FrvX